MTMSSLLVPLKGCGLADAQMLGHKAAVLGELAAEGFPVPAGAVLLPAARELADDDLAAVLADICPLVGPGPYAVRSSGPAEDLADRSFAGLYETLLDVADDGLLAAVRTVWASAGAERVLRYHGSGVAPLAVLVQQMVPATAAGVAFTADPVTGDRASVLVNAVAGLGDRLVAGEVSPDEWAVRDGAEPVCRRRPVRAVDAAVVSAVAALARRVEARFGSPQDIEWAVQDGEPVLLQARPITALPEPVAMPVRPPVGFWEREASHSPKPWTPMLGSVLFPVRNEAFREMFDAFGFLADTLEFTQIGGWEYQRLVPLGGRDRAAPPAALMPLLIRVVPALRARIRTAVAAVRTDVAGRLIRQWYDEWQPDLAARTAALRTVRPAELDDAGLAAHTDAVLALFEEGCRRHFLLHGAIALPIADLVFTVEELLGWPQERAFELLGGLSVVSTRPAHRLAAVTAAVAARPAVRDLLLGPSLPTTAELDALDDTIASMLRSYVEEFGHRALRYEIADPTIAEVPELTLRLLADQVRRGYDPDAEVSALARRRARTAAEAREQLATASATDQERFERVLAAAQRAYPVREDNEFLTFSVPLALLRYAVLEHGARLAARGDIRRGDDVFWLTLPQARSALAGERRDLTPVVDRARGERVWAEQHPGPGSYGTPPGPPPPMDAMPPEVRFIMRALLWSVESIFASEDSNRDHPGTREPTGPGAVSGIAASAGRYTGPVRVIVDELEFDRIRPGDVLVCPVTSPVWSVVFPTIGALVTDTGGLLSHPAIIAREYRIPAVVATSNATTVLRDGQLVTVDGTTGQIELLD